LSRGFRFSGLSCELGSRLRELRQQKGLTQQALAREMGRTGKGAWNVVSRLETGRFPHPSVSLVAEYLCACRASFTDISPVLDRFARGASALESQAREAVARSVASYPLAVQAGAIRYDVRTSLARRSPVARDTIPQGRRLAERAVPIEERVKRAANLARVLARTCLPVKSSKPVVRPKPAKPDGRQLAAARRRWRRTCQELRFWVGEDVARQARVKHGNQEAAELGRSLARVAFATAGKPEERARELESFMKSAPDPELAGRVAELAFRYVDGLKRIPDEDNMPEEHPERKE
jgi:transcriptional regulator with XRE-family HTH domain